MTPSDVGFGRGFAASDGVLLLADENAPASSCLYPKLSTLTYSTARPPVGEAGDPQALNAHPASELICTCNHVDKNVASVR